MLRFVRKWIISSFGFSKSEANGSMVLILLVLIIAVVPRWIINTSKPNEVSAAADKKALREWYESIQITAEKEAPPFPKEKERTTPAQKPLILEPFDPNRVTIDELVKMGLPLRIAQNLVNYRAAGGSYQKIADLEKIYGVDDLFLEQLRKFLVFPINPNPSPKVKSEAKTEESGTNHFSAININQATAVELTAIKGIGPVLSKRIIKYRTLLGGFHDYNQLYDIYGLDGELINDMKKLIYLDSILTKININDSEIKNLSSHPYIDYSLARSITNYRKVHGPYQQIEDLKQIKIISDSLFQKLSPYISVAPLAESE